MGTTMNGKLHLLNHSIRQ